MAIQTLLPYDVNERNAARQAAYSVAEGLDNIVQRRLQKMNQQQQRQDLKMAGYTDADINVIQSLPQQDLFKFLSSYQPQTSMYPQDLSHTLGQQLEPRPMQGSLNLGALGGPQPQDAIMRSLSKTPLQQRFTENPDVLTMQAAQHQNAPRLQQPKEAAAAPLTTAQRIAQTRFETPEMKLRRELAEKKSSEQAYREGYRYNKDVIDKSREQANRARQDNEALESVIKANKEGHLYQGPIRKILEKLDLQDVITNTPTQFVAKQLERFVTGAPSKFGTGRFTNFLAESYQKGLPRLVNSKEAFDLIARNIILENKAIEAQHQAMREIIKESESSRKPIPYDLADQAIERAQPKLDKYAQQSIQNLEKALNSGKQKTSFDSLPSAKEYTGKSITDSKTGAKYKSDGSKWVKV